MAMGSYLVATRFRVMRTAAARRRLRGWLELEDSLERCDEHVRDPKRTSNDGEYFPASMALTV